MLFQLIESLKKNLIIPVHRQKNKSSRRRSAERRNADCQSSKQRSDAVKAKDDAEDGNNQERPSTSAETPKEKNNGTPTLNKEVSGLAPPFKMPNGKVIPPEQEDEFGAKRWGLTEADLALPYAAEAAAEINLNDDILMEVTDDE